jgi:hypothetical protein
MQNKLPIWIYTVILGLGVIVILTHIYKAFFNKDSWINYIHILLIGPLLVYIGLNKDKTSPKAFLISIMLAGATFTYHLYRLILKIS